MANITQTNFGRPQLDVYCSSDDDFRSVRETQTPASRISSHWEGFSPAKARTAQLDEPLPYFDSSTNDGDQEILDQIPPPRTLGNDGKPLLFNSLELCFEYLQEFAKNNGFAVKKGTTKKMSNHLYIQYVNCVRGGSKHTTKVSTPNRARK